METIKKRIFTKTCGVNFSSVQTQEFTTKLDSAYHKVTGIAVANTSTVAADRFRISISEANNVVIDAVISDLLEIDKGANPQDRFIPIEYLIRSQQTRIQITPLAGGATNTAEVDVTFRIETQAEEG